MDYGFLLSYASFDRKHLRTDLIREFFDDLDRHVRLRGFQDGGFLDAAGIQNGQRWEPRLAGAIVSSRILVPLCSPNYFRSPYCGREWQVFASRYGSSDNERFIMPVLWIPTPDLLKAAPEIQNMHESYPAIYKQEGLCYLMSTPRYREQYEDFLHVFAVQLACSAEAIGARRPWPLPSLADVTPAFPASREGASAGSVPANAAGDPAVEERAAQPAVRWYDNVRWKPLLWLAVALFICSNFLSLIGSSGVVVAAVNQRYGAETLHLIQSVMSKIVAAGVAGAYLLGLVLSILWFRQLRIHRTTRFIGVAMVMLATAMAVTVNVNYSSHRTGLSAVVDGEVRAALVDMTNEIMARQEVNAGPSQWGFRYQPDPNKAVCHVWTTAQCSAAVLKAISGDPSRRAYADPLKRALLQMESQRTFPDGWGYWPDRKNSVTEVISWVVIANALALEPQLREVIWPRPDQLQQAQTRLTRDIQVIIERQHPSGGWAPIADPSRNLNYLRTYSTVMALWALVEARQVPGFDQSVLDVRIRDGVRWLLNQYVAQGSWFPNPSRQNQTEKFPGLDAQVLYVLYLTVDQIPFIQNDPVLKQAKLRFVHDNRENQTTVCHNERTHESDTPLEGTGFSVEPSTFLWFPWSIATLSRAAADPALTAAGRAEAETDKVDLALRLHELRRHVTSEFMYVRAESAYCLAASMAPSPKGASR